MLIYRDRWNCFRVIFLTEESSARLMAHIVRLNEPEAIKPGIGQRKSFSSFLFLDFSSQATKLLPRLELTWFFPLGLNPIF